MLEPLVAVQVPPLHPLAILAIGLVAVVGMIIALRVNAFIALISAAMLVSLLAPGELAEKIARVAEAFGDSAGSIGIVIALAAVIGKCLMDSGAADRIVRSFLKVLGERRAAEALAGAGFVLAIPVFFDTVFYLMVPLARSLWRTTRKNYMLYILAIGTGGAITHAMVPPTPGPLLMADILDLDVGRVMLVGIMLGFPTAVISLLSARVINRLMPVPCRPYSSEPEPEPLEDSRLPGLLISLAPVVLPVILISANTITKTLAEGENSVFAAPSLGIVIDLQEAASITAIFGNANLALLLSAAIALVLLKRQRRLTLKQVAKTTEVALMSGGVIILITAGGGAFGKMLAQAEVGDAVKQMFASSGDSAGVVMLVIGFGMASVLKIAQGSSTVAMITAAGMLAAMAGAPEQRPEMLGFHPVYLAMAIAAGSLVGSWMNDSGFWIFARMSGLTEIETLKSWTIQLIIIGLTAFGFTLLAAKALPMV